MKCCQPDAASGPPEPSCCGGHDHGKPVATSTAAPGQYTCPMHPEVISDSPGECPKCGMALEQVTPLRVDAVTIYTCPMHPEIEQDHPGDCPKCGMPLEPKAVTNTADEHAQREIHDLSRKFWIGLAPICSGDTSGMLGRGDVFC
ncbi:MAG: hypothetical protein H7Y36_01305 [Armatimonadetes bacterium]|nr:hypothetical protein [Akkermansiaceae bacterium]